METVIASGACPGGWGKGPSPPPSLEIEKQKKKQRSSEQFLNCKLFHLYFATFLVGNIILSAIFELGPLEILKKSLSDFRAPPPPPPYCACPGKRKALTYSWTRHCAYHILKNVK